MPKKAIQGTPWYQLVSNRAYADAFNFFGPHIAEREKLIEDGEKDRLVKDVNGKDTSVMVDECRIDRLEQSDMIMILMNLAYIPDEVVHKIDFTVEQWSKAFLKNMQSYKRSWEEKTGQKWQWQTDQVEADLKQHFYAKKSADTKLNDDLN